MKWSKKTQPSMFTILEHQGCFEERLHKLYKLYVVIILQKFLNFYHFFLKNLYSAVFLLIILMQYNKKHSCHLVYFTETKRLCK